MTTYAFRNGFFGVIDDEAITAQVAGEELERIHKEHGKLTAPLVVDEARPKDAPLHPVFEWDNETAAEKYRLVQARTLIRTVEIVRTENEETEATPAYVSVRAQDCAYEPMEKVVSTPDLFENAFNHAYSRLGLALRALEELQKAARQQKRSEAGRYADATQLVQRAQAVVTRGH
jgi:hypothetical protein